MSTDGLFDVPAARPVGPPPEQWTRITTNRPCDWCARTLADNDGNGPRPAHARWRHRAHDGTVTLLCYEHARGVRAGGDH